MNHSAILAEGFECLSYPLSRQVATEGGAFSHKGEWFVFGRAPSRGEAEMAVVASDSLAKHAAAPIGIVKGMCGGFFVVSRARGKFETGSSAAQLPPSKRRAFASAVIFRLASLHSGGFGCGGLSQDAVEYSQGSARLLNPSRIFALVDGDAPFFEVACTIRSLAADGFVSEGEITRLCYEYLSHSPVCRAIVSSHCSRISQKECAHALASCAKKYLHYI